jgi:hypothetical protein
MKLSSAQLDVLQRLASCDEPLSYFRGGFWTLQSIGEAGLDASIAPAWYTTKGTVDALERKGLLKQTNTSTNYPMEAYPTLENRVLSAKGLAVATGTDTPAHGLVEAVVAYTGRVLHYSSYRVLDNADWAALVELEPSLNDATAAFISGGGDIFIHTGYEADALHELVHAAGVKPGDGDNVFVCEGLAQVATEEIAKSLSLSVRKNYKDEVAFVRKYLVPATGLKARELVALYIEAGLEGLARAVFGRCHDDVLRPLVAELRRATGPGPILKSLVAAHRVR